MFNLINYLKKPYPLVGSLMSKMIWSISFGTYVFLFLLLFRPFGLITFNIFSVFLHALAFGGITFSTMFLNLLLLPWIFPKFFSEEHWTTGREILLTLIHIFLIGVVNFFFVLVVFEVSTSINTFLYLQFVTILFAIVPVTVWTLIVENRLLKKNMGEARLINASLGTNHDVQTHENTVTIRSESKPESQILNPDDIWYITSADNYIQIGFFKDDQFQIKMVRSTLKNVEIDLRKLGMFFRCHRAFIVNLEKVESVYGNARGLKLRLKNCTDEIPVSRALNKEIGIRLKEPLPA